MSSAAFVEGADPAETTVVFVFIVRVPFEEGMAVVVLVAVGCGFLA